MECDICGKPDSEGEIYRGFKIDKLINVCEFCAEEEKIPIIKKPTQEQISKAERRPSVRERMERMSGLRKNELTHSQMAANKNLAKLRAPPRKQFDPRLIDNYDWEIRMARRRKKLTVGVLAERSGISRQEIQNLEKGQIVEDLENVVAKLELYLDIKLLKEHPTELKFKRVGGDKEKDILEEVKIRMKGGKEKEEYEEKKKSEKMEKISRGEVDMSKKENLKDVKLSDLIEMKRKREEQERRKRENQQEKDMFGEDDDLDLEEL